MSERQRRCPCTSGMLYAECCGRFHAGAKAPTALALMRSRYCAFVIGDAPYLRETWHPSTRPRALELDADIGWTHLDIIATERGGPFDHDGIVEFVAHYRGGSQRERSKFARDEGRWLYVGEEPVVGR
jgi:SEC-C motif domain protein